MRGRGPHTPLTTARSTLDSPIVTMIIEMIGSPMSGRRTARSMIRPMATAATTVSTRPRGQGSPICTTAKKIRYVPKSSRSPCAKLMTSLAL